MLQIVLPEQIFLGFWTVRLLRNILKHRYYAVIKITDRKSKTKDLIIVRSMLQGTSAEVGKADSITRESFIRQ